MGHTIKILLIDTGYDRNELNESINIDILLDTIDNRLFPRLSITTIYCKLDEYEKTRNSIECYINIDAVFVSTKISSFAFYEYIEKVFISKPIFAGGVLATYINEELACKYKNTIYLIGEGETNLNLIIQTLLQLHDNHQFDVPHIKAMLRQKHTPNVCFWDDATCSVYTTSRSIINIENVHTPLQHRTLERLLKYDGIVRMETSRGCPWNKCSFCVMPWRYAGAKWRAFPEDKIVSEISVLIKQGSKQIFLTDEDFVGNKEHILYLCNVLMKFNKDGYTISIGGSTSVYTLLQLGDDLDNILRVMHKAGITTLFVGIESGSESQLRRFRKGVTVQQNREMIKRLTQYDWLIDVGFIMFDAETTMTELDENLHFISECNLQSNMSRFAKKVRIVPHTAIFEEYKKKGYIKGTVNFDEMYYDYDFQDANIRIILVYLEKLSNHIIEKTYNLQAQLRYNIDIGEKHKIENQLSKIRNFEYLFLKSCVTLFHEYGYLTEEMVYNCFSHIKERI